ncbi:MAG: quinolinate synthase NadA [Elusimicrobiota bacterium]
MSLRAVCAAREHSSSVLDAEIDRLAAAGLEALGYGEAELERLARKTLRIAELKKEKDAVIPAHVYQRPEILAGAADFTGDSYRLAKLCMGVQNKRIVFCGVRFMAETAKILNPGKEVFLPSPQAGCSLAEAVTARDVLRLKAAHPGAPAVCYINTTAETKAECDCVVTSANAPKILRALLREHKKIIFLPDEWMGLNLAAQLGVRAIRNGEPVKGTGKGSSSSLVIWKGRCVVHENFDAEGVKLYRKAYPGVKILVHTECAPALVRYADFAGGTGGMMEYVRRTSAPSYMLITECGMGDFARSEFPDKRFIPMCRMCPYMKQTELDAVLRCLESPSPRMRVEVDPGVADRARLALERMFELAEKP